MVQASRYVQYIFIKQHGKCNMIGLQHLTNINASLFVSLQEGQSDQIFKDLSDFACGYPQGKIEVCQRKKT